VDRRLFKHCHLLTVNCQLFSPKLPLYSKFFIMRLIFGLILLTVVAGSYAQTVSIIPQPVSLEQHKGAFVITKNTALVVTDAGDESSASFFNNYLKQIYGFQLAVKNKAAANSIVLTTRKFIQAPAVEGYQLISGPQGVRIEGDSYAATFQGIQTLIQLLPVQKAASLKIASVTVKDAPRFAYRGMHLDVGRHFFPIAFIKKYIDYLALHKMNYFHWHLTDDQGWRIEIKKYPRLTQIGGFRNGTIIGRYPGTGNDEQRYGGYYTQDEIKDIVAYAAQRFITVVPEIELPGHASAAIAAYPILSCFPSESTQHPADCAWAGDTTGKQVQQTWGVFDDVFCAGKETTFEFLQDVMDEVMELFPGKLLHVGGDECPKSNWKRCPQCQQRMRDHNLKDEHELQSYFIQRMEKYLNSKGRSIIGWDEILEGGLAPNAAVMSWRGEEGGITAAKQKHNVVMTPGGWMYFDHTQSEQEDSVTIGGFTTVQKVYSYEPIPAALTADEGKYILGAQANLWTEYIKNPRKVEYMVFPRMSALSEVQWSSKENRNWDSFEKRLQTQFRRYDLWKANYSKAYFDLQATVQPAADYKGLTWKLATKQAGAKISYLVQKNGQAPAKAWAAYKAPIAVQQSLTITARSVAPNGTMGNAVVQEFKFNKATGKPIQLTYQPGRSYPGDGAFTLVNGIQNTKGLARSKEFLGFEGDDCEAVIDLGNATEVKEVIAHILEQNGSWIYRPQSITVWLSDDGSSYREAGTASMFVQVTPLKTVGVSFAPQKARYVKVLIKNHGLIGDGQAGAGHKAWLFVDELEVN